MIAAIVQARMGSTRFPGKVLKDLCGHPVLWHVVTRVRYSRTVNRVIVAAPAGLLDDPIASFCEKERITCFRGNESDVLDRYYQAAKWIGADIIVRITADCPMIDPRVIDGAINVYLEGNCDYASNGILRTYPDGLDTEVFSFSALEKAWREARLMSEREHVTPYIWKNDKIFKLCKVVQNRDISNLRWTVDEPEDLEFVRNIYSRLYDPDRIFLMDNIVMLLDEHPEFLDINKRFGRNEGYIKSLREDHEITPPIDSFSNK